MWKKKQNQLNLHTKIRQSFVAVLGTLPALAALMQSLQAWNSFEATISSVWPWTSQTCISNHSIITWWALGIFIVKIEFLYLLWPGLVLALSVAYYETPFKSTTEPTLIHIWYNIHEYENNCHFTSEKNPAIRVTLNSESIKNCSFALLFMRLAGWLATWRKYQEI